MAKSAHQTENVKISAAALRLAAAKGWDHVTLEAIAKGAKLPIARIKKRFTSKYEIASVIVEETGRETLELAEQASGAPHDVLFDLLMARFDVLQKNRKGVLAIAAAARHDRDLSCALARAVLEGMYATVDAARINAAPRPVLAAGLFAVYGWAFLVWRRDESRDMAKTMAALDRILRLTGKAATLLKHRSSRAD